MARPTTRTWRRRDLWWLIAAVGMALVGQPILWWRSSDATLGAGRPGVLAAVLVVAVAAPLAIAARRPLGALLATTFALLAYEGLRPPFTPIGILLPVLFAWAVMALPPRRAIVGIAVTAGVSAIGPLVYGAPAAMSTSLGNLLILLIAGVIGLLLRAYRSRSEQREDAARVAAEHAVVNARYAVLEERLRIARELHDSVGHSVTLTALRVEAAARLVDIDPAKAAGILHDVSRSARQTMTELHRLVALVREPGDPGEPGFTPESETTAWTAGARLRAVIARFSGPGLDPPLDVTLSLDGNTNLLLPEQEEALAAVAAEALCNVTRHAGGARRVQVRLAVKTPGPGSPEASSSEVCFEIADDGAVLTGTLRPGLGLQGVTERARALGGSASLKARPQGGCVLRVVLPLKMPDVPPVPWEPSPSRLLDQGHHALVGADSSVTDAGNANRAALPQEYPMAPEPRS